MKHIQESGVRSQKPEVRGVFILSTVFYLLYSMFSIALPIASHAGLRGMPEGKPKVDVGEKAPLGTDDLRKAHEQGSVILLMFGNPDHCIHCEKVWSNITDLCQHYENDVAAILKIHRASKFWGPEDDAVALGKIYGVIGEPWLFLIDKEGIIRHIFKGFTGREAIEAELKEVIK